MAPLRSMLLLCASLTSKVVCYRDETSFIQKDMTVHNENTLEKRLVYSTLEGANVSEAEEGAWALMEEDADAGPEKKLRRTKKSTGPLARGKYTDIKRIPVVGLYDQCDKGRYQFLKCTSALQNTLSTCVPRPGITLTKPAYADFIRKIRGDFDAFELEVKSVKSSISKNRLTTKLYRDCDFGLKTISSKIEKCEKKCRGWAAQPKKKPVFEMHDSSMDQELSPSDEKALLMSELIAEMNDLFKTVELFRVDIIGDFMEIEGAASS